MRRTAFAMAALMAVGLGGPLSADPVDDTLIINGETEIVTHTKAPEYIDGLDEIWSGWAFRSAETRAIEADDFDNPGMIFVEEAEAVWNRVEGGAGKSCASCHGDPSSMKGVRTVMPKYNEKAGDLWSLEDYINDCRVNRMQAEPWGWNDKDMVNMTALISVQSRGMPMNVAIDGPAKPYWEKGREMYYTRTGQLELSCANCHEDHYGDMIRADHLSQGQINGFPTYRLKNAKLNSIHARFKGCVRDTRAATYKPGSPEFHALELYVASRGNGLSVEGVAVRN